MATEVILPKLGMNTETVTILAWRKQEGDQVSVGDVLAEVETEKATVELEAEASGILRRHLAAEGDQVSIQDIIAIIASEDEDISALIARASKSTGDASASHVETIYTSWRTAGAAQAGVAAHANGNSNGHASLGALTTTPLPATGASASTTRLDPGALRARLEQRGVLATAAPARRRIVIYGSGLGARQILEVTRHHASIDVIGLIDDNPGFQGSVVAGKTVLGGFDTLVELTARGAIDAVCLSFHSEVRKRVHERIRRELSIRIEPLVDPRAMIGMDVTIQDGALIEAGAVIGPGTTVAEGTIVDVGAVVAHDCYLGPFSHLSPGCTLSGVVCLTENVLVGVGASLNSTITIGRNVIITPGAAVMNDLGDDVIVGGVPAKVIGTSRRGK
jgi:sugar O-acyltransferase (sialic acid O-acetyltransferase NeuD family)